jgi:hypothetical protein
MDGAWEEGAKQYLNLGQRKRGGIIAENGDGLYVIENRGTHKKLRKISGVNP